MYLGTTLKLLTKTLASCVPQGPQEAGRPDQEAAWPACRVAASAPHCTPGQVTHGRLPRLTVASFTQELSASPPGAAWLPRGPTGRGRSAGRQGLLSRDLRSFGISTMWARGPSPWGPEPVSHQGNWWPSSTAGSVASVPPHSSPPHPRAAQLQTQMRGALAPGCRPHGGAQLTAARRWSSWPQTPHPYPWRRSHHCSSPGTQPA